MPNEPGSPMQVFLDALRSAAAATFSQTLASNWNAEIGDVKGPAEAGNVSFAFTVSGKFNGNFCFQISKSDALQLSQKILGQPVDPAQELTDERKQATAKLFEQVVTAASTSLTQQISDVQMKAKGSADALAGPTRALLTLTDPSSAILLEVQIGKELEASMKTGAATAKTEVRTGDPSLDRLLGVDLNLSLRFGQRSLTLREILDLASGSIVELDRRVEEPAELLLGGKLIARGEVVVVDGNYGIRVTEVLTSQPQA